MTLGYHLVIHLSAVSKERWQEVSGMIPDSLLFGIIIRAPHKTSAAESGNDAMYHLPVRSMIDYVAKS